MGYLGGPFIDCIRLRCFGVFCVSADADVVGEEIRRANHTDRAVLTALRM